MCCDWFGWNKSKSGEFGMMKPLYAHKVADNGKTDVWFICHSNLRDQVLVEYEDNGYIVRKERNHIYCDYDSMKFPNCERIDEFQINALTDTIYPMPDRITFAKNFKGDYVFLGVYKAENPKSTNPQRVFYRVSTIYPK